MRYSCTGFPAGGGPLIGLLLLGLSVLRRVKCPLSVRDMSAGLGVLVMGACGVIVGGEWVAVSALSGEGQGCVWHL